MSSTMSYEDYSLRRDVNVIAKFVGRMTAHREKLALWRMDSDRYPFPRPPAKDSKWESYGAAHRLEKHFGLETHAGSVPELAALLAEVLPTTL